MIRAFLIGAALLTPFAAAAEPRLTEHPDLCRAGEYVLTVADLPALREKALQAVDALTAADLQIAEEAEHAILIADESILGRPAQLIPNQRATNLCDKLKRREREALAEARSGTGPRIVRRFNCGCNGIIYADATPNDPYYYLQWGLNNVTDIDLDTPEGWNVAQGSHSVIVGVIDSGIDFSHPDLQQNMWQNPNEIPGNYIDDDGNGYVDDIHGVNTINNSGNPMDDNGHGTHVAGIIGASGNNGIGVCGVSWRVQMVGIKFLGSNGQGSLYDAVKAIDYATGLKNRGFNIVLTNNSWGGGGAFTPIADAISRAAQAGLTFVAAAGNSAQNIDSTPSFPAAYPSDSIVSVAAVDRNGNLANFSNYGAANVDIAAPGVEIASTYPANRYVYLSGTSMAAPFVSGALALLHAYSPGIAPAAARSLLYTTAQPLPALQGVVRHAANVNLNSLLLAAGGPGGGNPTPTPTPPATPTPAPTATPAPTPTPYYALQGRVLVSGSGGSAIADAVVTYKSGSLVATRVSGADGSFDFGPMPAAPYTISFSHPAYAPFTMNGNLSGPQNLLLYGYKNQYYLYVRVIDEMKFGVPSIAIDAGTFGTALTDSYGWARIAIPFGAQYTVAPAAPGSRFNIGWSSGTIWGDVQRVFVRLDE